MNPKVFCLYAIFLLIGVNSLPRCNKRTSRNDNKLKEKSPISDHSINKIEPEKRDQSWENPDIPYWSQVKSAGDKDLPSTDLKTIRSFPMNFFAFNEKNQIIDHESKKVLERNYMFIYSVIHTKILFIFLKFFIIIIFL